MNTELVKYAENLELQNRDLKNQIRKRDEEINRLVEWKQNHPRVCTYRTKHEKDEFGCYDWLESDCGNVDADDSELERYWTFCPYCGGEIERVDEYEEMHAAYTEYIDSEISWRKEQACGV